MPCQTARMTTADAVPNLRHTGLQSYLLHDSVDQDQNVSQPLCCGKPRTTCSTHPLSFASFGGLYWCAIPCAITLISIIQLGYLASGCCEQLLADTRLADTRRPSYLYQVIPCDQHRAMQLPPNNTCQSAAPTSECSQPAGMYSVTGEPSGAGCRSK